jgi:glyoxylase-like metal-dependent hydrolase (beta-lactamase superfamily II)
VLPSHDPSTLIHWPPASNDATKYTIQAIKVGQCEVRDYITFQDSNSEQTSTYYLYIWIIKGGPRFIVVETGPKYPSDVSHVIVTHLHADHYDYFDAFPNARFVVNRHEYEETTGMKSGGRNRLAPDVRKALASRPDALQLVVDEEVVPGVQVFQLGCHTPGSQGVLVRTKMGPVVIAGDVVYKYENIEKDRPSRSPDERACREAMVVIRSLADIVLPAHDPLTLERWPDGVIGSTTNMARKLETN